MTKNAPSLALGQGLGLVLAWAWSWHSPGAGPGPGPGPGIVAGSCESAGLLRAVFCRRVLDQPAVKTHRITQTGELADWTVYTRLFQV